MMLNLDFPEDVEFSRLLARQTDVDLTMIALEIARDAYPSLNFSHTLQWIAKRGRELIAPATRCRSERELLQEVTRCLAGTHGLHGDREAFQRPESSYLHRVIETGVGIPISLSLVYTAVAQQAGIDLVGVAAPMHFLARYDGAGGVLFLDAFHHGRILSYDRCVAWLRHLTKLSADEIEPLLEPARPRDIITRLLNNLKALHVQHGAWEAAWQVQRRLLALQPSAFEQRRDLALIALKSNRPGVAVDLIETCLKDCDDEQDRTVLYQHLRAAEQLLSEWN
uniref:Tetratricopeptide repeat protein n=1 Tax=Schlesneria paludicola TaxID=360056 RepID=A0A7C4QP40_9PLAN